MPCCHIHRNNRRRRHYQAGSRGSGQYQCVRRWCTVWEGYMNLERCDGKYEHNTVVCKARILLAGNIFCACRGLCNVEQ